MHRFLPFLIFLAVLVGIQTGYAQNPPPVTGSKLGQPVSAAQTAGRSVSIIDIDAAQKTIPLAGKSEFWIDVKGTTSVSAIESRESNQESSGSLFRPTKEGAHYFLHNKALWIRFDARINSASTPWYVDVGLSTVDDVSLHWRDNQNRWVSQYAGDAVIRSEWPYTGRTPLFKLAHAPGEVVTYFMRIGQQRVSFAAPITLYQENALVSMREKMQWMLGAYSGWMLLIILASFAFATTMRDPSFVYCGVYIVAMWLSQATYTGIAGQYFWPESTWWIDYAPFFLATMTMATGLAFARYTLKPWLYSGVLSITTAGLVLSQILIACVDLVAPSILGVQLTILNSVASLGFVYAVIFVAWRRGDVYARWLALGFMPVLLGVIPQILRNLDLMATNMVTQYSVTLGAAIAAPMTLYAMIMRSNARRESVARSVGMPLQDPLTGLANMRALLAQMHGTITRARRYKNQYALILVELMNHEWFLQEHGQEVADRSLVLLADALSRVARDVDLPARLERNQFLLLVEGPCTAASLVKIAARISATALIPSDLLPVGSTLKLRQTVALMPDIQAQSMGDDANEHLGWMLTACEASEKDTRQTIHTLNF